MVDTLQPIVLSGLLGYVLGSVPFGVMISRLLGKSDPRSSGSGNIGATNVARASGYGGGALTLVGDGGKGFMVLYGVAAYVSVLATLSRRKRCRDRFRGIDGSIAVGVCRTHRNVGCCSRDNTLCLGGIDSESLDAAAMALCGRA